MLHDTPSATMPAIRCAIALAAVSCLAVERTANAQDTAVIDPVVVTATRQAQRSFDLPASVDTIPRSVIEDGQPMINLSETLVRVPGLVAQNRQNYAQDLQISSRGFGARSTFGVRGIRLYQDDIPATMPDGQGQTGSFQLLSTERIEVLRGPFSALYGNAAGGVISVFTESGAAPGAFGANAGAGSFDTWTAGLKATGRAGDVGYVAAVNRFSTDGFRDHSSATRTLGVAKLTFPIASRTSVTLLGTWQDQPDSQDPLGLTRAQWQADRRAADAAAEQFDTRKTVRQLQGGARIEHAFSDTTTLRFTAYGGHRDVRQYLALTGVAPTSSGGVVDLDREFGGASVKLFQRGTLFGGPVTFTLGVDYDEQSERRQGFVNNFGIAGDLRRDEDDRVRNTDVYAQLEWRLLPRWSLLAGVRASEVRFRSDDHYIVAANPDDSGSVKFRRTTPVVGVTFHATDHLNVYATYGEGFETPTFAELAYRPVGTGLNFDLAPATSQAVELGMKALVGDRHRFNAAWFSIDTDDEIVTNAATGGRTTFRNAGKTRRRGFELAYDGRLPYGLSAHAAYTWLSAEFASDFTTGLPPVVVAAGTKLPGVPKQTAFGELVWSPPGVPWLAAAVELLYVDRIYVNDRNSDFAPSYTVANLRASVERTWGRVRARAFARVNNLADRNYVGSVIVGDTNGRFFEPAPGRNYFVGASLDVRL